MPLSRGERVCAFVEKYCVVPEGDLRGQPLRLDLFQREFILEVFDNPAGTRRAFLSIARKNAKTATIACILLAFICGPEAVTNSRVISGAMSKEQAAEVYNYASKMIQLSPDLSRVTRIVPSGKRILGLVRNVEYQAVSAEGRTAHGKSPVIAILDEVGQVRGPQSDFIDAIVTSQGAYDAAMLFAISTQAPNDGDLFSIWLDDAKSSGDKRIVSHVYSAPIECDVEDEEGWAKANPALGKFRSLKDLAEQASRAKRMPSFEPTFRNLCLNQRVEMNSPFISRGVWLLNSDDVDHSAFYESEVYAGLDLSGSVDLTALVLIAFKGGKWHVKPYFWTPEKGIKDRASRDRAPYDVWVKQGYVRTTPGAVVDYAVVAQQMLEIFEDVKINAIAFDRWRIELLKAEVAKLGANLPLVPHGQGFRDMSPALETLEKCLLQEQVAHGANPVLLSCAAAARTEADAAGNRKLTKAKATGRIDGLQALAQAFGVCGAFKPQEEKKYQSMFF